MLNSNKFGLLKLQRIWTSPSPYADYGAGTITIPETDSDYLVVLFNDRANKNEASIKTVLVPYEAGQKGIAESIRQNGDAAYRSESWSRIVRVVSKTQLSFTQAQYCQNYNSTAVSIDNVMIPYQVLALKLGVVKRRNVLCSLFSKRRRVKKDVRQ